MSQPCTVGTAPARAEFRTTDSTEAINHLNNAYRTSLRVRGARDGHVFRHDRMDAEFFAIDEVWLPLDLRIRQAPLDSLVVVRVDAGQIERECDGVSERFGVGDIFVDAQPGLPATLRMLEARMQAVMLNVDILTQVAATVPSRAADRVRITRYQPKSAEAAARWDQTVAALHGLLAQDTTFIHDLVRGNAARMLAATALDTFPNNALREPTAQDRRDATTDALAHAIDFIEEFAHVDISGSSPRSWD